MALDKNALLALIANLYPDNNTQLITPAKLREGLEQMVSSDLNLEELTSQEVLGLIVYSSIALKTGLVDPAHQEGLIFYDNVEKALTYYNEVTDVKIPAGETLVVRVFNSDIATILKGQGAALSAPVGGLPAVVRTLATTITGATASGVALHDIPVGTIGYVVRTGKIQSIDTSAFSAGDTLFASDVSPGVLTNIPPALAVPVATVITSSVTGDIYTATTRLTQPVAIGQLRDGGAMVTQLVGTTPVPVEGYGNAPLNINTNVTAIASGSGFRGTFSPISLPFSGYYEFTGTAAILSSANVIVTLEAYKNGSPTGLISVIDLTNNNIDAGTAAISTFTDVIITDSDEFEVYISVSAATSTITYESFGFNMKRLGVS